MSKIILILTAVTLLSTLTYIKLSNNPTSKFDKIAHAINSNPKSTWKAQIFPGLKNHPKKFNLIIEKNLPENFDEIPNYEHL